MLTPGPLHVSLVSQFTSYIHTLTTRQMLATSADILIVYYFIYRVLKLIRGTRAMQTLVGMGLLALCFWLAKRLELTTVSWLFENLIQYFIIFLIVIFQYDIRRGLMQVGQNLFRSRRYEETYVIEEVVQAADALARHQTGALIVLERDADLGNHLGELGIVLDAKVTKELLVTLFIPDAENHMHDGAVIIKNLRLQQAGAVLPLSANAKLDKQLGTRHRAAIGITEETDAVVVVVSEERGQVSLCFNGNIARDLDSATLRKALLGLFQKKPKPKPQAAQPAQQARSARSAPNLPVQGGAPSAASGGRPAPSRPPVTETARPRRDSTPSAGPGPAAVSSAARTASLESVTGTVGEHRPADVLPAELLSLVSTQPMPRPPRDLLNREAPQAPRDLLNREAPQAPRFADREAPQAPRFAGREAPQAPRFIDPLRTQSTQPPRGHVGHPAQFGDPPSSATLTAGSTAPMITALGAEDPRPEQGEQGPRSPADPGSSLAVAPEAPTPAPASAASRHSPAAMEPQ